MGFLDSILKSVKREVERDVTRNAVDAAASTISNAINKQVNNTIANSNTTVSNNGAPSNERYQGYVVPNNTQNGGYKPSEPVYEEDGPIIIDGIDYARIYKCDRNHFRTILKESFPEMTLTEDVAVKDIIPGLNGAYQSVEFLLSDGGTPKVAIQLRSPSQATKVGTQRQFQQHGIGYISLWTDYKNQKEYIEKRVKDALWN
ncbi:MAG: hypothetical protein IKW90_02295 [Lachnospiraceae bacterium]|nr:hypothetical protein [Lachnospiraceae bacterium]